MSKANGVFIKMILKASPVEAVNLLVSGELDVTKYKDEERGRRYDVRVRLNAADRTSVRHWAALGIHSTLIACGE